VPTLRIVQSGANVEVAFEDDGLAPQKVTRPFSFSLSPQDAEDIRWYLEDYLVYPLDPQPKIAKRIEQRIRKIGHELFLKVLAGTDVWFKARERLEDMRVEVESDVRDAVAPWELLRDPDADMPLALHVHSFVRGHSKAAMRPRPTEAAGKVRILLAICRLEDDRVPFRSVARHLIKGLSGAARENFVLEVLRPPTFAQLAKRLRAAKAAGEPFHVIHFDGHGTSRAVFFENPKMERNAQPVEAAEIGKLLRETGVPVLILNACKSAHAEPPQQPEAASDIHQQIREFGSLAHAVMDYGAVGVVAWRYNVFVSTAAQFMADLYASLASGLSLGEAATLARKQLNSAARPIQDWTVPVVFEAAPVRLFPKAGATIEIKLEAGRTAKSDLPQAPDVGFIGRDETILKLDRMFDTQQIVLLHAYAGSGKTSTAAEFASWYTQTDGLRGPVLFTSFEQHKKLPEVLDQLGRMFESALAKSGKQWLTLDDGERRSVALQLLKQVPVLWICDNVEPISGFPKGTPSQWTGEEQKELADFLRAARGSKAKFLLTSRRDEQEWLHDLPGRVPLPNMPLEERVQMTRELAEKHGRHLDDVEDWRPLLRFTQGNPLTLTVLVGQALRDGLRSRAQIEDFVRKLQTGEAVFEDEESEGRTRSLAASLAYGFENAFTEAERKQLALLHLFQGFVDVDALGAMGNSKEEWCLPEVRDLTREAGIALLDRVAEVGLLTAVGEGYYTIHPALPWFFRRLFEQYYAAVRNAATHAYVEAMGRLGDYYHKQYEHGNQNVIGVLAFEEANLVHARSMARSTARWGAVIGSMQGLDQLYDHTGRHVDWARLVAEIIPDFVDPATDGPLPGREDLWNLVTEYRVRLAEEARRWEDAERWQKLEVEWNRQRTAATVARPPETWDEDEKGRVRTLAASLHALSEIQREVGSAACVDGYQEALGLAERIGDTPAAAVCAFGLGNAFSNLDEVLDLSLAERWYRRSLDFYVNDGRGRAQCLGQLGFLASRRFLAARDANRPDECVAQLTEAARCYEQALAMFPADAVADLRVTHNQLGIIYRAAGQIDAALRHFQESVRCCEILEDRFGAGGTRFNAASTLARAGRFVDALDWARSALHDYEACGNADREIVDTLKLIKAIESDLPKTEPPS
jgi:tetratricopeptide (TPR) repeat protein